MVRSEPHSAPPAGSSSSASPVRKSTSSPLSAARQSLFGLKTITYEAGQGVKISRKLTPRTKNGRVPRLRLRDRPELLELSLRPSVARKQAGPEAARSGPEATGECCATADEITGRHATRAPCARRWLGVERWPGVGPRWS